MFFLCSFVLFSYIIANDVSTNTLSQYLLWRGKKTKSLSTEKIKVQFKASHNNLGLISVKIDEKKPELKPLAFRIKEIGQKDWFFEKDDFDYFYDYPTATVNFGFPVIKDSKNRVYVFEFETGKMATNEADLRQKKTLNIASNNGYFAIAKYNMQIGPLFTDIEYLKEFLLGKINFFLQKPDSIFIFCLFFTPFFTYLILMLFFKEKFNRVSLFIEQGVKNISNPLIIFTFLVILIDTKMFYSKSNEFLLFLILLFWIIVSLAINFQSKQTFIMSLTLLFFSSYLLLINYEKYSIKLSYFIYYLLIIGSIQAIIETTKKNEKEMVSGRELLPKKIIIYTLSFLLGILLAYFCYSRLKNNFTPSCQKNCLYLKITSIEPSYVYPGQKVILIGTNFCNNDKINCIIVSSNKKSVFVDLMSGGKIIFTIPLGWKNNSEISIRIDKKISLLGKTQNVKSNTIKFKLLDPLSPWDADTDAYFKQMKNLSDEAKRINGLD